MRMILLIVSLLMTTACAKTIYVPQPTPINPPAALMKPPRENTTIPVKKEDPDVKKVQ